MHTSPRILIASVLASLLGTSAVAQAAEPAKPAAMPPKKTFVVPKTEFGHPDLRGVWNYSSDTPLERPPQFKGREFLTKEEIATRAEGLRAQAASLDGATFASVGGYNMFWMDSFAQLENARTSLIIDPPDGRLPPLQPGIKVEMGGLGPDTGGNTPATKATTA